MKTILTAVDFSPITPKVISAASAIAAAFGARLVILHVTEPAAAYVPVGAAMDVITAPLPVEPPDMAALREKLEQLAAPARSTGISVETVAEVSLPIDAILKQADKTGADMLVLGSHGHGALYHLFSGSVVTSILEKATLPVTVIPIHGK